ncbi:Receptor-type tyrosine-protein phosphatase delta, partial [Armadillidium nasatum]
PYDVTGVQTETVSDSVIKVSWEKTSNPCPIQGYEVSWNGTVKWDEEITLNGYRETNENATSFEIYNLIPYSVYDFYVNEITTDGIIGNRSEPSRAETFEGAASAPTPVTSLTLSSSSIQVNWSLPEAPNGVITGYHISCQLLPKTDDDCDIEINDINVFTATAETLLECGDYTISVQAVNGYGRGEPAVTTATTDPE